MTHVRCENQLKWCLTEHNHNQSLMHSTGQRCLCAVTARESIRGQDIRGLVSETCGLLLIWTQFIKNRKVEMTR